MKIYVVSVHFEADNEYVYPSDKTLRRMLTLEDLAGMRSHASEHDRWKSHLEFHFTRSEPAQKLLDSLKRKHPAWAELEPEIEVRG